MEADGVTAETNAVHHGQYEYIVNFNLVKLLKTHSFCSTLLIVIAVRFCV